MAPNTATELIDGRTGTVIPSAVLDERIALNLPPDLRIEDWQALGRKLCGMEQRVQWWLGDWWAFGDHTYGSRASAVADGIFGRSHGGLRNIAMVARKFEPSCRHDDLSFTHHQEVAALPPHVAQEVLASAKAHGWSVKDTRAEVIRRRLYLEEPEVAERFLAQPAELANVDHTLKRTGRIVTAAFADWFGLGDAYANVLMALYKAGGMKLSWRALAIATDSHQPMNRGATQEAISCLRTAFEAEAIDRDDDGYWLTEIGFAECRQALRDTGARLLSIGAEPANDPGPLRAATQASD